MYPVFTATVISTVRYFVVDFIGVPFSQVVCNFVNDDLGCYFGTYWDVYLVHIESGGATVNVGINSVASC